MREGTLQGKADPNALVAHSSESRSGDSSQDNYLRYRNGTIHEFDSCPSACQKCFVDHFQACIAYCQKGCQEYCEEMLPREQCKDENPDEVWVAKIGSLFDVMSNPLGRMCQFNSPDGCPEGDAQADVKASTSYPIPEPPYFNEGHDTRMMKL